MTNSDHLPKDKPKHRNLKRGDGVDRHPPRAQISVRMEQSMKHDLDGLLETHPELRSISEYICGLIFQDLERRARYRWLNEPSLPKGKP